MSCLSEMDNSVHLKKICPSIKKIRDLENKVGSLKAEIVDIKVTFADRALCSLKKVPTPSYADSVRGSVATFRQFC